MSTTTAPHPAAAYHQRRTAESDEKILSAAREILDERGLAKFTIERVAWVSGVAKTTIYRRYENALTLAAAATLGPDSPTLRNTVREVVRHTCSLTTSGAAAEVLLALALRHAQAGTDVAAQRGEE